MKITAAVLRERTEPLRLEEAHLKDPGAGELRVRIVASGLCHTDSLPRIDGFPAVLPIVPGHEGAGVVEAVGAGVTNVHPGDHVVLSYDSCGHCEACLSARPFYCSTFRARNMTGRGVDGSTSMTDPDGAEISGRWFGQSSLATHSLASARNVVVVDPKLPLELLAPLGCGVQTGAGTVLNALKIRAGATVAIFGIGAVGLSAVLAATLVRARQIVAIDVNPARLQLALELGATDIIDASAGDGARDLGSYDFAIDTTGNPGVMADVAASVKFGGECAFVAGATGPVTIRPDVPLGRRMRGVIQGESIPQVFIPEMIDLWRRGHFPFDRLIEHFDFADVAAADAAASGGAVIKPVLRMSH